MRFVHRNINGRLTAIFLAATSMGTGQVPTKHDASDRFITAEKSPISGQISFEQLMVDDIEPRASEAWESSPGGCGGIGRHAGFRFLWRKSWGFKSLHPHQSHQGMEIRQARRQQAVEAAAFVKTKV
jgi:hypothetical protein